MSKNRKMVNFNGSPSVSRNIDAVEVNETSLYTLGDLLSVLVPITLAGLLYTHNGLLIDLLLNVNVTKISVLSRKKKCCSDIAAWLRKNAPRCKETPDKKVVWQDVATLCDLISSVVPGACSSFHRGHRLVHEHAQRLAYKYLGIEPVFSDTELHSNILTPELRKKLVKYMKDIHEAIKIMRDDYNEIRFSENYIAKGMGLVAGERNRKCVFYIYANPKQKHPSDILVTVKGPYATKGVLTVPAMYSEVQLFQKPTDYSRALYMSSKLNSISPTVHGTSFLRRLSIDFQDHSSNHLNECDILIKMKLYKTQAKISFVPIEAGIHEVSLTTNGCHVIGSPFAVPIEAVAPDTSAGSTPESMSDDDQEEVIYRKKIISRIIDFIDEKMVLDSNGRLIKLEQDNEGNENNEMISNSEFSEDDNSKEIISDAKECVQNKCKENYALCLETSSDIPKENENLNETKSYVKELNYPNSTEDNLITFDASGDKIHPYVEENCFIINKMHCKTGKNNLENITDNDNSLNLQITDININDSTMSDENMNILNSLVKDVSSNSLNFNLNFYEDLSQANVELLIEESISDDIVSTGNLNEHNQTLIERNTDLCLQDDQNYQGIIHKTIYTTTKYYDIQNEENSSNDVFQIEPLRGSLSDNLADEFLLVNISKNTTENVNLLSNFTRFISNTDDNSEKKHEAISNIVEINCQENNLVCNEITNIEDYDIIETFFNFEDNDISTPISPTDSMSLQTDTDQSQLFAKPLLEFPSKIKEKDEIETNSSQDSEICLYENMNTKVLSSTENDICKELDTCLEINSKLEKYGIHFNEYDEKQTSFKFLLKYDLMKYYSMPSEVFSDDNSEFTDYESRATDKAINIINDKKKRSLVEKQKEYWEKSFKKQQYTKSLEDPRVIKRINIQEFEEKIKTSSKKIHSNSQKKMNDISQKLQTLVDLQKNKDKYTPRDRCYSEPFLGIVKSNKKIFEEKLTCNNFSVIKLADDSEEQPNSEDCTVFPSVNDRKNQFVALYHPEETNSSEIVRTAREVQYVCTQEHVATSEDTSSCLKYTENSSTSTLNINGKLPMSEQESILIETKMRKARYKQAKLFFQSLEESNLETHLSVLSDNALVSRSESAPCLARAGTRPLQSGKYGGSFCTRRLSDRFHVSNFFQDIVGDRNEDFLGIPNKTAVVASLASLEPSSDAKLDANNGSTHCSSLPNLPARPKRRKDKELQNFHPEYPHVPMTDVDEYKPRSNPELSGLVSRQILLTRSTDEFYV